MDIFDCLFEQMLGDLCFDGINDRITWQPHVDFFDCETLTDVFDVLD